VALLPSTEISVKPNLRLVTIRRDPHSVAARQGNVNQPTLGSDQLKMAVILHGVEAFIRRQVPGQPKPLVSVPHVRDCEPAAANMFQTREACLE
jgi:hypothetical protein